MNRLSYPTREILKMVENGKSFDEAIDEFMEESMKLDKDDPAYYPKLSGRLESNLKAVLRDVKSLR